VTQHPPETVGFVGLGTMGSLMSARLLAAGYRVRALDPEPAALEAATSRGAERAASPADAASGADVVVLSLPSPAIVEEVVAGEDGILAGLAAGGVIVDMSTIDPDTTRRLHTRAAERGSSFLDAPVSGGPMKAETGELTIMVGGDAEALERCRPLLDHLGARVVHVGPSGNGQAVKLCNNMLLAIIIAGLAETIVTGVKVGVDARVLADVVGASTGANSMLESWLPLTTFADDYAPRFSLDLLYKDVALFGGAADAAAVPVPVAAATEEMLKAARARGLGRLDMTAAVRMYEELAGVRVLGDEPSRPGAAGPRPGLTGRDAG
jgi:3-hydroxyisobutyrate dehydrogenase